MKMNVARIALFDQAAITNEFRKKMMNIQCRGL